MTVFDRISFTQDEENCILHFLQRARESGRPSSSEPWYEVIDGIMDKHYREKYKNQLEGQWWQTI